MFCLRVSCRLSNTIFSLFIDLYDVIVKSNISALHAVTQTLAVFTKMFNKSRDENAQLADAERKKLEKEALKEQTASNSSAKKEADADKDLLRQINNRVQRSAS